MTTSIEILSEPRYERLKALHSTLKRSLGLTIMGIKDILNKIEAAESHDRASLVSLFGITGEDGRGLLHILASQSNNTEAATLFDKAIHLGFDVGLLTQKKQTVLHLALGPIPNKGFIQKLIPLVAEKGLINQEATGYFKTALDCTSQFESTRTKDLVVAFINAGAKMSPAILDSKRDLYPADLQAQLNCRD